MVRMDYLGVSQYYISFCAQFFFDTRWLFFYEILNISNTVEVTIVEYSTREIALDRSEFQVKCLPNGVMANAIRRIWNSREKSLGKGCKKVYLLDCSWTNSK